MEFDETADYFRITFPQCSPLICRRSDVTSFIEEQFEYMEPGGEITIKRIELTQQEFEALPESDGC